MTTEEQVRDFYSNIQFPGTYDISQLEINTNYINPYLKFYHNSVQTGTHCLDIGCGTGLISNFLAKNNPNINFDAVDFSESIEYAKDFAQIHNLKNINYLKYNFLEFPIYKKYDVVICTGVLHHMPEYIAAINLIKNLANKKIIIGIYNTYAKLIQKNIKLDYANETYRLDQESVPFELSFTNKELLDLFKEYKLTSVYPSINNKLVDFKNLFNYKNGGLTLYEFEC